MQADPHLLATWLKGWTLSRSTPSPVSYHNGWRVDVGWEEQRMRYVFPGITDAFRELGQSINEPFIFLKAAIPADELHAVLPAKWAIQPQGYLMSIDGPMRSSKQHLPPGYTLRIERSTPVTTVRIHSALGEVASVGHSVVVDGYVIYDRIDTLPEHRRLGLASIVLCELEKLAGTITEPKGLLVATAEGKCLYESLGWRLQAWYSTAVIPPAQK